MILSVRFLSTLFFCITFFSASAQKYAFTRFSVEEGLPRSGVYCLMEDSDGFIWIGTEGGGVAVFDGREFQLYNTSTGLGNNTVRVLYQDKNDNIWMGTNGSGLIRFDGTEFKTIDENSGLSNNYVRSIVQDSEGHIWAGTYGGGLNKLSVEEDSIHIEVIGSVDGLPSDIIRYAIKDSQGVTWFGTDGGLVRYVSGEFKTFTTEDGIPHKKILVLFEDVNGNIWLGTKKGATKFDGKNFTTFNGEQGLISDRVRAIGQDKDGDLWFGTKLGVSRFDGSTFKSFTEDNGLSNNRIRDIISDKDGNVWFGTYFGGINRYSGDAFIHFSEDEGFSNEQIESVETSPDGVWVGTHNGANRISMSNGDFVVHDDPFNGEIAGATVLDIVKDGATMLFATDQGVYRFNGGKLKELEVDGNQFTESVHCLLKDDETLWLGCDNGLYQISGSAGKWKTREYYSQPNLNEGTVSSLLKDALGNVWIGFLKKGLMRWDGSEFMPVELPGNLSSVTSIAKGPNGFLWVGTDGGGLVKTRLMEAIPNADDFEILNGPHSEISTNIHQLVFDSEGDLWIGTPNGVQQLELNNRAEVKEVHTFTTEQGFRGTETSIGATVLDGNGNIWFGSIKGLTRYASSKDRLNLTQPRIHITDIDLGEGNEQLEKTSIGSHSRFHLPDNLKLEYDNRNITFKYSGIDMKDPGNVRYQWMLDGYTKDWSPIKTENVASFTNLPQGNFTFKVRAWNSDGTYSESPAEFSFRIIPPFWMRWWFILIAVLIIGGIVYGIVKLRERTLLQEQERLQGMVDERTKELRLERDRSEELLLNILPQETADELKTKGYASVKHYDRVSVLFTDFVGFTNITEKISHQELVNSLDEHFRLFDGIMDKYGIEKIKTIGDAYMAAGGIPVKSEHNPLSVTMAGLEMIKGLNELNAIKQSEGKSIWQLRLGIHTGSVISGVVGKRKFAFDIWGDAVNTAARMESSGDIMKVNVSGSTHDLIKEYFMCTSRGKIKAKNKGEIEMYFVERLLPKYSA
ncbi:MAG: ligand-binding sensor domain-containing protein/class 3 adenylate cyclase, partial [Bacteroidia bacterium]